MKLCSKHVNSDDSDSTKHRQCTLNRKLLKLKYSDLFLLFCKKEQFNQNPECSQVFIQLRKVPLKQIESVEEHFWKSETCWKCFVQKIAWNMQPAKRGETDFKRTNTVLIIQGFSRRRRVNTVAKILTSNESKKWISASKLTACTKNKISSSSKQNVFLSKLSKGSLLPSAIFWQRLSSITWCRPSGFSKA